MTLTPGTDFDSSRSAPGACTTQRSMRVVIVFSIEVAGMPG